VTLDRRCRAILAAWAIATSVVHAEDTPPPETNGSIYIVQGTTSWNISIDASGHVVKAEPRGELFGPVREPLAREIARWQFMPGKIDGHDAPT